MRKLIYGLVATLALLAVFAPAVSQQTLPANTVLGRLGIGPGPAQSIPFSVLTGNLLQSVLSGDCTITSAGVITCTKTGGVNFAASATTNALNATNISSGTLPVARLSGGVLTNTRLAKTTTYTVDNADKGKTIDLGGSNYYTVSLGAASGYDADFATVISNTDARAKLIAPNAATSFRLWPGQTATFRNVNNAWTVDKPNRRLLTANATIAVDPSAGSDSTAVDGLTTGSQAFQTLAYAYGVVQKEWDLGGAYTVTVVLPSGTIAVTAGNTFVGPLVGAQYPMTAGAPFGAPFIINGAGSATTNYTSSTASVDLFQATAGAGIQVQNLSCNITGSASHCLTAAGAGYIAFQAIDFKAGNTTNGAHMTAAGPQAVIRSMGNWTVSGNINIHAVAEDMAIINLVNQVTVTGTPAWTTAFVQADLKGFIEATGFTFTGAGATGKRVQVISQGTVFTNGGSLNTFFPGNAIGTVDAASFAYFN